MKRSLAHPVLLIVDDDRAILDIVGRFGKNAGFDVVRCAGGREAISYLEHARADLAVVDLRMPDVGGLDVLRAMRDADPDCQVILMSGDASVDSVVEAIKLGATDYLTKPFDFARLKALLTTVKYEAARRRRLLVAEQEVAKNAEFCGMIGRSPAMQELFGLIRRLAPHLRTALITGETGVGKELVARAMPEVDGYETLKALRAEGSCSLLPVIVLTAEDGPQVERTVLELGADDYLIKPFDADVLLKRVSSVFARQLPLAS